jgi:hypothetical protein
MQVDILEQIGNGDHSLSGLCALALMVLWSLCHPVYGFRGIISALATVTVHRIMCFVMAGGGEGV